MNAAELLDFDVAALGPQLRAREISPVELTDAYLSRIEATEPKIRAYITVLAENAREAARQAEHEIGAGRYRGPFHGVPIALKDLCYTDGLRTTGGSKIFADLVPDFDCTVWARLRDAGAVLLGKLNLHEFASGVTNANPHWGFCRNPYDLERIPGGSSGGSAAAIVARSAVATIGTDTGGSIRIPAAYCGCVGLKQTWSRVSRYGVIPLADSLDHAGPITRSVRDAALMLQVIAGHDPNDATSSHEPVPDYCAAITEDLRGVRVGVIRELMGGLSDEVARSFNAGTRQLAALGAELEEVAIPAIEHTSAIVTNIMWAEAADYHEEWLRTRADDYGVDVRRILEAGMLVPGAHYVRSQRARAVMLGQALDAHERCTVLVAPTAATTAPRLGANARAVGPDGAPVDLVAAVLRFTAPFNITGQPALALPTGLSAEGMPLSMQIIGKPFDEATVIRVAAAYETARGELPAPRL